MVRDATILLEYRLVHMKDKQAVSVGTNENFHVLCLCLARDMFYLYLTSPAQMLIF